MVAATVSETIQTLVVQKDLLINAPVDLAWEAILEELGPASTMPDGLAMPMVFEPWPGGRWFRDLGNNEGHLWAHVQVIKAPTLIELTGPLFMSYPAINHVQYRLVAEGTNTRLKFIHRGLGDISAEHRDGVNTGWNFKLNRMKELAEAKRKSS